MIALTSLLVSLFCIFAWARIGKIPRPDASLRLFRIFFLLMGLSSFFGGIVGHAFMHCLPFVYKIPGWALGMFAVTALEQVSIMRARPLLGMAKAKALSWLNITQLVVALSVVLTTLWFPVVEIHSAFGFLLVVVPLEATIFFKTRSAVSRFVLGGILMLVGAVAMHIMKISVGVWFCYFDKAHLFMCGAVWMFMLAAERLPSCNLRLATAEA